jgi:tRNA pseudouridine55 synthase
VICIGNATRLSDYVMGSTKKYRAVIHAGATTDTYDAEGEILETRDATHLTRNIVEIALKPFIGDIQQIPPMYSAIKQGGKKLYDLARAGQTVERAPRPVTIFAIELTDWTPPKFTLDVTCSAGTYIRSLAYDVGEALGVGAYLAALIRTGSGSFTLDDALDLETLLDDLDWQRHVITPRFALAHFPSIDLTPDEAAELRFGRSIPRTGESHADTVMAYLEDDLAAIVQPIEGCWQPVKVFHPSS